MMSRNMFYSRTRNLIGDNALEKLRNSSVAVFGIGGVGGYVAETLARSGVSRLVLIDGDRVEESNLNRQIIATRTTLGMPKVTAMAERIASINPDCKVVAIESRFNADNLDKFDFDYDYIADCIDSVKDKQLLILTAKDKNIPIICAMGAGNRSGLPEYKLADIHKTSYDPLAKVIRKFCVQEGVKKLNVVYTTQPTIKTDSGVASIAYHPMSMASIISAKIVNDLIK